MTRISVIYKPTKERGTVEDYEFDPTIYQRIDSPPAMATTPQPQPTVVAPHPAIVAAPPAPSPVAPVQTSVTPGAVNPEAQVRAMATKPWSPDDVPAWTQDPTIPAFGTPEYAQGLWNNIPGNTMELAKGAAKLPEVLSEEIPTLKLERQILQSPEVWRKMQVIMNDPDMSFEQKAREIIAIQQEANPAIETGKKLLGAGTGIVKEYVDLAKHPANMFYKKPVTSTLDTLAAASAVKSGLSKLRGGGSPGAMDVNAKVGTTPAQPGTTLPPQEPDVLEAIAKGKITPEEAANLPGYEGSTNFGDVIKGIQDRPKVSSAAEQYSKTFTIPQKRFSELRPEQVSEKMVNYGVRGTLDALKGYGQRVIDTTSAVIHQTLSTLNKPIDLSDFRPYVEKLKAGNLDITADDVSSIADKVEADLSNLKAASPAEAYRAAQQLEGKAAEYASKVNYLNPNAMRFDQLSQVYKAAAKHVIESVQAGIGGENLNINQYFNMPEVQQAFSSVSPKLAAEAAKVTTFQGARSLMADWVKLTQMVDLTKGSGLSPFGKLATGLTARLLGGAGGSVAGPAGAVVGSMGGGVVGSSLEAPLANASAAITTTLPAIGSAVGTGVDAAKTAASTGAGNMAMMGAARAGEFANTTMPPITPPSQVQAAAPPPMGTASASFGNLTTKRAPSGQLADATTQPANMLPAVPQQLTTPEGYTLDQVDEVYQKALQMGNYEAASYWEKQSKFLRDKLKEQADAQKAIKDREEQVNPFVVNAQGYVNPIKAALGIATADGAPLDENRPLIDKSQLFWDEHQPLSRNQGFLAPAIHLLARSIAQAESTRYNPQQIKDIEDYLMPHWNDSDATIRLKMKEIDRRLENAYYRKPTSDVVDSGAVAQGGTQ